MLDLIVDDDFYDDDSDDFYSYPVHGWVSSRVENYVKQKKKNVFSWIIVIRYSFLDHPIAYRNIIFRFSV